MSKTILFIHLVIWAILLFYWLISGLRAKKVAHQEPFVLRFVKYWFPVLLSVFLLGPGAWLGHSPLREQFIEHTNSVGIAGIVLCAMGAFIACWSRFTLGKNWSLSVQEKQGHELIKTGFYKVVRHPIYTGLLLMFFGTMIIVGDYKAIVAVAIMVVSFWFKLKKEEMVLMDAFGDEYKEYQSQTKALIPYII
ncbi:MAG: isoprenylcysteine carboxyl methyltransferase [Cytophagaceae bacterium]|nr:isoprenylcysteine carboxyl methyltransferase [Cytophagaceae bacterium]|tara:strand:+ start:4049 stop:4627 length:579 start_codon:yes stop_codon:yes gene_type:complete